MTPWAGWQAHRRIEALVSNPEGGEAEKGALVAAAFGSFVERVDAYAPDQFEDAVTSVVASIVEARPASAPLLTLANAVLLAVPKGPEVVMAEVRSVAERLRTSVGILATMGAAFVPDGGSVLAHGTSSSVQRVLEAAAATKEFRVVSGSGVDGAGGLFAAELSEVGIVVEMIDEDFMVESLLGVDLVVTGTFAFGPTAMINTPGTRLIVEEAFKVDRRVLLISSADKALPAPLFDRASGVVGDHGLEIVPLDLFEAVVTELGVLDPIAAGRLADRREVAPQLA